MYLEGETEKSKSMQSGSGTRIDIDFLKRSRDGNDNPVCKTAKETQMYRTVFWTLWEREKVG